MTDPSPGCPLILRVGAAILTALVAVSCTLLVDAQLSHPPDDGPGGGGAGGQGGAPPTSSASTSSATSTASSSSTASSTSSSSSGCAKNTADCDGLAQNGCEAHLNSDAAHCGACGQSCKAGAKCKEGKCQ